MVYLGKIVNGAVVLDGDVALPEGSGVAVTLLEGSDGSANDPLYRLPDLAVSTGIPDLAVNVDHYLYGHPKVNDDQP